MSQSRVKTGFHPGGGGQGPSSVGGGTQGSSKASVVLLSPAVSLLTSGPLGQLELAVLWLPFS